MCDLEVDSNDIRKTYEMIIFLYYSARRPFNVSIFVQYLPNNGLTQLSNSFLIDSISVTTDKRNIN